MYRSNIFSLLICSLMIEHSLDISMQTDLVAHRLNSYASNDHMIEINWYLFNVQYLFERINFEDNHRHVLIIYYIECDICLAMCVVRVCMLCSLTCNNLLLLVIDIFRRCPLGQTIWTVLLAVDMTNLEIVRVSVETSECIFFVISTWLLSLVKCIDFLA
jgi:hypothetical protein